MSLLSSIKSLVFPDAGLCCPRCEKPIEGHDEAACERRMSRRYFFGVAAGVAVAVAGASAVPALFEVEPPLESGIAIARQCKYQNYLNVDLVTRETLEVLRANAIARFAVSRMYEEDFMKTREKDLKFLRGDRW